MKTLTRFDVADYKEVSMVVVEMTFCRAMPLSSSFRGSPANRRCAT
ncbi:hypothetical protein [Shimia sp.]|nr:hypothetical protein [Shimia sp.]